MEATLIFQIRDWNTCHEVDENNKERYIINLHGKTEDDKNVCLKVTGFTPFFYVEVPNNWTAKQADQFVSNLTNKITNSLINHKLVQRRKFYDFTNKPHNFVLLAFQSENALREFANFLNKPLEVPGLTNQPMRYRYYEDRIDPCKKFMRINKLSLNGWVKVDKFRLGTNQYLTADYSYRVDWVHIKPLSNINF